MKQQQFSFQDEVSDQILERYDDPKMLLRFAAETSGKCLKEIAYEISMDEKQFLRCLSNNPHDNRHFPFEQVITLCDVLGNDIPLRWLALKRGFGLVRLKSALELENEQLRRELDEAKFEHDVMLKVIREIKG